MREDLKCPKSRYNSLDLEAVWVCLDGPASAKSLGSISGQCGLDTWEPGVGGRDLAEGGEAP